MGYLNDFLCVTICLLLFKRDKLGKEWVEKVRHHFENIESCICFDFLPATQRRHYSNNPGGGQLTTEEFFANFRETELKAQYLIHLILSVLSLKLSLLVGQLNMTKKMRFLIIKFYKIIKVRILIFPDG